MANIEISSHPAPGCVFGRFVLSKSSIDHGKEGSRSRTAGQETRGCGAREELVEEVAEKVETQDIKEKRNEQIFVLDTTAKPVAAALLSTTSSKKSKNQLAKQDRIYLVLSF